MLFLRITSWKGASRFNGGGCFSDGGASFLSGGCIGFDGGGGGVSNKSLGWGGAPPTMGNPIGYAQIKVNEYQIDCKQRMTIQQ